MKKMRFLALIMTCAILFSAIMIPTVATDTNTDANVGEDTYPVAQNVNGLTVEIDGVMGANEGWSQNPLFTMSKSVKSSGASKDSDVVDDPDPAEVRFSYDKNYMYIYYHTENEDIIAETPMTDDSKKEQALQIQIVPKGGTLTNSEKNGETLVMKINLRTTGLNDTTKYTDSSTDTSSYGLYTWKGANPDTNKALMIYFKHSSAGTGISFSAGEKYYDETEVAVRLNKNNNGEVTSKTVEIKYPLADSYKYALAAPEGQFLQVGLWEKTQSWNNTAQQWAGYLIKKGTFPTNGETGVEMALPQIQETGSKLVYTVDFRGNDGKFAPAAIGNAAANFDYTPSADGTALTIKGKTDGTDATANYWGGTIQDLTADENTIYTMIYQAKNNNGEKNSSITVGGWIKDGNVAEKPYLYGNYTNHNSQNTPRAALWKNGAKIGDYVGLSDYEVDANGFVTMKVVYDGENQKFTSYILKDGKTGENDSDWTLLAEQALELDTTADAFGLMIYTWYNIVDTTIQNVQIYKEDIRTSDEYRETMDWIEASKETANYDNLKNLNVYLFGDDTLINSKVAPYYTWNSMLDTKYEWEITDYSEKGLLMSTYDKTQIMPLVRKYRTLSVTQPDLLIVSGGLNDYVKGAPIGTIDDTTDSTYMGALNVLIKGLRQRYPNTCIVFTTGWNATNATTENTTTYQAYADAMVQVCEARQVYCFKAYDTTVSGIDMSSETFRAENCVAADDMLNLNLAGMKLLMPKIEAFLNESMTHWAANKEEILANQNGSNDNGNGDNSDNETTAPETTPAPAPSTPKEEKKGCGGVIGVGSALAVLAIISLAGASCFKKHD